MLLLKVMYGVAHHMELALRRRLITGCWLDHFRASSLVCAELLCSKGMPTGAASPLCIRSHQASHAQPAIFAGAERHNQLATAFKALSLSHSHLVPAKLGFIGRVKTGKSHPKCFPRVQARKGLARHLASGQESPISRPSERVSLPVQLFV